MTMILPKSCQSATRQWAGLVILDLLSGEGRGAVYLKQAFGNFYYLADGIEDFFDLLREPSSA